MNKTQLKKTETGTAVYNNAYYEETERGYDLVSYTTYVAGIVSGEFVRYWEEYSATTMRHVNSFLVHFKREKITKKQWEAMEVTERRGN